ncbi:MAG: MBOAT family protein [Clostridiales bacterium]|nr:MBOAT family protein [Clostridiales bacterium]
MLFNSIDFMLFFPIVVSLYIIIPKKFRCVWLLVASYYFYMSWNPWYALLILASTLITYICGILTEQFEKPVFRKLVLVLSLGSNLGILFIFKYADFFINNINRILSIIGIEVITRKLDLLLPVGISFYTFQALSYSIDVYRRDLPAERNILKYALFVSFFPQLVAGPIERSRNLLTQIQNVERIHILNYERVREGCLLMLWGLFQKIVIADRASIFVNTVYNDYPSYGFLEITIATVLFAVQIYCDFGGYSNIAIGAAKVMGFDLMPNFKQPYLALSINDFWKRWHISLTSWFTDYLYIPLGGNRKGILRKYINTLIVFGVSGLWHGARWNFVAWGMFHAIYKILGDLKNTFLRRYWKEKTLSFSAKLRKCVVTFALVDFAWIFFAANSFKDAIGIISQMTVFYRKVSIFSLGLSVRNWGILIGSILLLMIVDILHEKNVSINKMFMEQETWFRWLVYLIFLWVIIMFGIYGSSYDTSTFIYFQF